MMSSRLTIPTAAALAVTAFISIPATALAQGTAEQRSACMGDAFRFCFRDIPNVSKIEGCLAQNVARLHPACAAEFTPHGKTAMRSGHFSQR
jgi:hypothetical protein